MKSPHEVFTPRHFERDVIRHRLSWFATLQGLLFLSFVLVDKSNLVLTSLVVCSGIAMCLPAIASAYTSARLRNWLRVLLAILWATMGTTQFVFGPA